MFGHMLSFISLRHQSCWPAVRTAALSVPLLLFFALSFTLPLSLSIITPISLFLLGCLFCLFFLISLDFFIFFLFNSLLLLSFFLLLPSFLISHLPSSLALLSAWRCGVCSWSHSPDINLEVQSVAVRFHLLAFSSKVKTQNIFFQPRVCYANIRHPLEHRPLLSLTLSNFSD